MDTTGWDNKKAKRFVAFFDILGFKNLVLKQSHDDVLAVLEKLKEQLNSLQLGVGISPGLFTKWKIKADQTRAVTFSDSIIVFSQSDEPADLMKILLDCQRILNTALFNKIPIKGAISFGEVTVDFEKSLFFGQPLISAYELHDLLQLMGVVLDCECEAKIEEIKTSDAYKSQNENILAYFLARYKTPMKGCGKIFHTVMMPMDFPALIIRQLEQHYFSTSGPARSYIDNTLDFYAYLVQNLTTSKPSYDDAYHLQAIPEMKPKSGQQKKSE
jgi:hypothetical protein